MILGTGAFKNILGNTYTIVVMLLCLCANSWGACTGFSYSGSGFGDLAQCQNTSWNWAANGKPVVCGGFKGNASSFRGYCQACSDDCYCSSSVGCHTNCYTCSTQAEADSVKCELNPDAEGCAPPKVDSVKVCTNVTYIDNWVSTQYMQLYRCPENYSSFSECEGLMEVPGTCGQNGYEAGVQPPDSVETDVECFASFDGSCFMRDKATGNTFNCPCENNSCNIAMNDVANGVCSNPYATSSGSSSASSSGSSSPSSGGSSSPSSGDSGDRPPDSVDSPKVDSGGVWNYNYTAILNAINNNVIDLDNDVNNGFANSLQQQQMIRANTQAIGENLDYTNTLIKQSLIPSINAGNNNIEQAIHSEGEKTRRNNDSLYNEWSGLWSDFKGELFSSSSLDTSGFGAQIQAWRDSVDSASSVDIPNMSDSLGSAQRAFKNKFDALKDSINNGPIGDSIAHWQNSFLNNGVITGNGSNSCPAVLNRNFKLSFPNFEADFGNLGYYVCATIPHTNITFWTLARVLLRAIVTITCMWWLYGAIFGIETRDDD